LARVLEAIPHVLQELKALSWGKLEDLLEKDLGLIP
jgi:hypothetical protein